MTRVAEGKPPPVVYDYRDSGIEVFERMWQRRLSLYRSYLGNARLPQEFQSQRSSRGRASVVPLPPPSQPVSGGQMMFDFGE